MSLEHEEREEVPWSTLVAQADDAMDRRWLIVGGVVAVVIVTLLGVRLMRSSGQPVPEAEPDPIATVSSETVPPSTPTAAQLVVAEDDLVVGENPAWESMAVVRAEWFVTDFFTRDRSAETTASVLAAVTPSIQDAVMSLRAEDGPSTFVEWAKAHDVQVMERDSFVVSVLYRSILESEGVFVRRPVLEATVAVEIVDGVPRVTELPESVVTLWSRGQVPAGS